MAKRVGLAGVGIGEGDRVHRRAVRRVLGQRHRRRRDHRGVVDAGDGDGHQTGVGAALGVGDGVGEGVLEGLATVEGLDGRHPGRVIGEGTVGVQGEDHPAGQGAAEGGGDQGVAGIDVGVVGQHPRPGGDHQRAPSGVVAASSTATGASLRPVTVIVDQPGVGAALPVGQGVGERRHPLGTDLQVLERRPRGEVDGVVSVEDDDAAVVRRATATTSRVPPSLSVSPVSTSRPRTGVSSSVVAVSSSATGAALNSYSTVTVAVASATPRPSQIAGPSTSTSNSPVTSKDTVPAPT